jgi:hypothetical protein
MVTVNCVDGMAKADGTEMTGRSATRSSIIKHRPIWSFAFRAFHLQKTSAEDAITNKASTARSGTSSAAAPMEAGELDGSAEWDIGVRVVVTGGTIVAFP